MLLIPKKDTFNNSIIMCNRLKATLAVPKDAKDNKMLFDRFQHFSPYCEDTYKALYWVGAKADLSSGQWIQLTDGRPIQWHNFNEPSLTVHRLRRCITAANNKYPYEWWQTECNKYTFSCALCNFTSQPPVRLRGFCKSSLFERKLFLNDYENERLKFDGMMHSQIVWENGSWVMRSRLHQELRAVMEADALDVYPFGVHTWSISGDTCVRKKVCHTCDPSHIPVSQPVVRADNI